MTSDRNVGIAALWAMFRREGPIDANGLQQIADYKYVAGSYTPFDLFLNPFATKCCELLPVWMAPNLVTSLGGSCIFLMLCLNIFYSPDFTDRVPSWVLALNGPLLISYTWMDWLDGKQARRTGTSSPLGQLFDHGVDCLCVIGHFIILASVFAPHLTSKRVTLAMLTLTQTGFFCAQLVEYYYHWLPHAIGGMVGVSETNVLFAVFSVVMAFVDHSFLSTTYVVPILGTQTFADLCMAFVMFCLLGAVWGPLIVVPEAKDRVGIFSAVSLMFAINLATIFAWPDSVVAANGRMVSIAAWSVSCYITVQVIVFSMAKQEFSLVQYPVFIYCLAAAAARYFDMTTATTLLVALNALLIAVLVEWAAAAIQQITRKLGIKCFSIPVNKKDS